MVGVVLHEAADHAPVRGPGAERRALIGEGAPRPRQVGLGAAGQRPQQLVERLAEAFAVAEPGGRGGLAGLGPVPLLGETGLLAAETLADLVLPGRHVKDDLPDA